MCFSQYAQYAPRPVKHHDYDEYEYTAPVRPEGAPPTKAELDDNLFGPKPLPPQWQKPVVHDHAHSHEAHSHGGPHQNGNGAAPTAAVHVAQQQANGQATVASVTTQTVEAVVVELSNGTKLLICPL